MAVAGEEQAKGVALIDESLEQLAEVTQAVAGNADESNDAAAELSAQSGAMRDLIAGFRMPGEPAEAGRGTPVRVGRDRPTSSPVVRPTVGRLALIGSR
jgi:methyl-accepting chemotaxis protein